MSSMSLRRHFFTNTAAITIAVMLLSMLVVDISYRGELERSTHEKLRLQVFSLLSRVTVSDAADFPGIVFPEIMANPALNELGSGYWLLAADEGQIIWHSLSIESGPSVYEKSEALGGWQYGSATLDGNEFITAAYWFAWEYNQKRQSFHLVAGQDRRLLGDAIWRFRMRLIVAFFLITLALMLSQYLGLKRAFRPIAELEGEIAALEKGDQHKLKKDYPKELNGVRKNLNALIEMEHKHREHYRASMADMAHSLKTPLSLLMGELPKYSDNQGMKDAVERINNTIEYQLRRAVLTDHHLKQRGTESAQLIDSVLAALQKLYDYRELKVYRDIQEKTIFRGDENDLTEVLGNLLDNAFKHANNLVSVSLQQTGEHLEVIVADDGEGLSDYDQQIIFSRGERLDNQGLGQGIGLAIVYKIVSSYGGSIEVDRSRWGGASFKVKFPIGVNHE